MDTILNINTQFWKQVSNFIGFRPKIQDTIAQLEEKGQQIEKQILDHYGVEDVDCYNVESHYCQKVKNYHGKFDEEQFHKKSYIHTISTRQNPDKPNLVFIHGYWSSSLSFIKCLKPLSKFFNVYLIDLPGQALSSRVPFPYEQRQEMLDYFVNNLEEWRKNMFQDKKIYLAGHSFGGFLAGHYALKYEEKLESLYLISPFGIYDDGDKPSVHNSVIYYTFQEQSQASRQAIYYIFQKLWNLKVAVSDVYQNNFLNIGNFLLKNFLNQTLDHQNNEFKLFHDYYDVIMKLPVGSEKCMTTLLKFPQFTAFDPLENSIQKLKIPVHFYYGKTDWMEKETANQLIQNKKINGTYSIIENSSHNIQFENPTNLSEQIINQLKQNNNVNIKK